MNGKVLEFEFERRCHKTDSTEHATAPKSTKSRNWDSSVEIQSEPKPQFGIVPRDTEDWEFVDLVEFGVYGVATIGKLLKIIGLFCRISSLS